MADENRKKMSRTLFERYAPAVAYVGVETTEGDQSIGSAFHVGEGVFVTARHVVENCKILKVATTVGRHGPDKAGNVTIHNVDGRFRSVPPG